MCYSGESEAGCFGLLTLISLFKGDTSLHMLYKYNQFFTKFVILLSFWAEGGGDSFADLKEFSGNPRDDKPCQMCLPANPLCFHLIRSARFGANLTRLRRDNGGQSLLSL